MENSPTHLPYSVFPDGRIIRPGLHRASGPDALKYTQSIRQPLLDNACVFCPELTMDVIDDSADHFFLINASAPYEHFDGQRVVEHQLLIPRSHVETIDELSSRALAERALYLAYLEAQTPDQFALQTYTRDRKNPSKSIPHLHTHLFKLSTEIVDEYSYNIREGVTKLTFLQTDTVSDEEFVLT